MTKISHKIQVITFNSTFKTDFLSLNIQWISKYFQVEEKDKQQLENPEQCIAEGGEIFFAIQNNKALGTCALYSIEPGVYELAKMGVSPNSQGQGVGDLLMKACESWAQDQKADKIFLLSNSTLLPAMKLYQKHGYKIFLNGPHPDYDRCNIGMEKPLSKTSVKTGHTLI